MNKVISSLERVFMSLVGPSGSGKSQLIHEMLRNGTFQPAFDKIIYFYQYYQTLYSQMLADVDNMEFIKCVDFEMINNLPNDGTNYLLIFDDSCAEISRSKEFEKLATAGRHKKLNVIYIKHNLFHKSPIGRDVELQNTHIVLFKSPRDVNQISKLGQQLGLGKNLEIWYKTATEKPFGHLLIDLSPRTSDRLRFCTDSGTFPTKIFLPSSQARITQLNDDHTKRLYSQALPDFYSQMSESVPPTMSKGIHHVPVRMHNQSLGWKTSRYPKVPRHKVQKTATSFIAKNSEYKRKKINTILQKRYRSY